MIKLLLNKRHSRLKIIFISFLLLVTFGFDYNLAKRIEHIIDSHQSEKIELTNIQSDMCNALTGNIWGPQFSLRKVREKKIAKVEMIRGSCDRSAKNQIIILKKLNSPL